MNDPISRSHAVWVRAAVSRYERSLLRYSVHLIGDVESSRDIVQEVFLQLCNQQQSKIEPRLAAWLFTVCRNKSLDFIRREKRMKTASTDQVSRIPSADTSLSAEQQEDVERLDKLVSGLSNNQQEVLRLKYQGGLSYREISEVTKLSVSNVGYLLHTALTTLRKQIASQ